MDPCDSKSMISVLEEYHCLNSKTIQAYSKALCPLFDSLDNANND